MNRMLLLCLLLSGCAVFHEHWSAQELKDNHADDASCVSHGLHYPQPNYVDCRWTLAQARLRRQRQNAEMLRQSAQPPPVTAPHPADVSPYEGEDRANFHCHAQSDFDELYVLCEFGPPQS